MKKVLLSCLLILAGCLLALDVFRPGPTAVTGFERSADGLLVLMDPGRMKISPVTEKIIRVRYTPYSRLSDRESLVVLKQGSNDVNWELEETDEGIVLSTGRLRVEVNRGTGALAFLDREGEVILSEPGPGAKYAKKAGVMGEEVLEVRQEFEFSREEALYGLGQFQNGYMNFRGKELLLVQSNMEAVNPFLVSTRGYGLLWDNYSKTRFKDSGPEKDGSSIGHFWSEVADGIDYYFIYGPGLDQVISGYREITGPAPMFGKWAYGYFQSKERYQSFDELIEVVTEYRRRGVPLDTIVQDWMYWGDLGWNPLKFDVSGPFRNPEQRIREIHDLNAHIIISIWPNVCVGSEVHAELLAGGHLYKREPLTMDLGSSHIYDAYNEEARDIYWKHVKNNIFDLGMDGFWMDATEPETGFTWAAGMSEKGIKRLKTCDLGTMARYLNTYSLVATRAVYEGQRQETSEQRVYILTRSAFAGQQRYAAATWSGDITATWPVLKKQIPAGLNFCMAGIPYWTTDIGGFFTEPVLLTRRNKKYQDPAYRELYLRWFQYGAFCPIFRSHGTNTPREVWRFGEPGEVTYDTLVKFDRLRYRLLPYIYSLAWKVFSEDYTLMRGLALDFRHDPEVYNISDQFMFGPALLVNPVTEPIGRERNPSRKVYLPKAPGWYDFWTGERHQAGKTIFAAAPLSIMPLYVKAGSILTLGPVVQYATEKSDPLEVRIYPGADARFTLYQDENENYNYEKGMYSTVRLEWDDSEKTMTIRERQGRFPGLREKMTVNLVLVGPGRGVGVEVTGSPDAKVIYQGRELNLKL